MKLAASNLAWEVSEDQVVRKLFHDYAVTGVEIAPTKIWPAPAATSDTAIQAYKTSWTQQDITPVAAQSVLFGQPELTIFQNTATRKKTLAYLKAMIKVSAQLGAKVVVFGSPKNRLTHGLDRQQIQKIAAPFFTELGEAAQQHNITFCIEPNAKAYGCDFITNTTEGVELVQLINHPHVGLNLDSGILTLNQEDYAAAVTQALPYLRHVHISEPFLAPISPTTVDHKAMASALRSVNYSGWISIEMKAVGKNQNLATLAQSLKLVTELYL